MWRWIQKHLDGPSKKGSRVGVDIGAQSLRVVCMPADAALNFETIIHEQVPLTKGAMNGAEIEDFDEVLEKLCLLVDEMSLHGCHAAFSFPSMAVRRYAFERSEYLQWLKRPDDEVIQYLIERLKLPQGDWCFDWASNTNGNMCAVMARQDLVMDRYALAEQAELKPTVLDLERLATDRFFQWMCQQKASWPQLWVRWCDGLLFTHAQTQPGQGVSAVRYCWQTSDLHDAYHALLDEMLQDCGGLPAESSTVTVRWSGFKDKTHTLMNEVFHRWPHAIYSGEFDQGILTPLLDDDWSVALGLAMHPGLQ